jgi:hypothetical protein
MGGPRHQLDGHDVPADSLDHRQEVVRSLVGWHQAGDDRLGGHIGDAAGGAGGLHDVRQPPVTRTSYRRPGMIALPTRGLVSRERHERMTAAPAAHLSLMRGAQGSSPASRA